MGDTDPAPEAIEAEFSAWNVHIWHGVNQLWYALFEHSSPPIVLTEENTTELRAAIASKTRTLL